MKTAPKPANLNKLMDEVGGAIDQAIEQAAREAALEDIAAGRSVPIWQDGKVVWKPAVEALAQTDAAAKRARR
jgi:hypothetical protein